ncbi:uncharacterized protein LOC143234266 isoform X3 [Tachypleus tridentatus]|uniref:uncharacterized protein LOC143234266 isoform X3 n=1 Tax=Tachypleus tridentatus TaxID=6853 RepID=UPI003FD17D44
MEVVNIKVESCYDEKPDGLLDIKLEKNEDEILKISSRKADYVEERSLQTVLKFDMIKEEKEDNYGSTVKTETVFVQEKMEQPGDLLQDDIISKFSDSNDDDLDSSSCNMNMKTKTEFKEEINPVLENISGPADYIEERSLHTIFKFDMIKQEKEDNCDGETVKTEEKTEQSGDLLEEGIISKFSDSSDDDLDSSNKNVMNVKTKTEFKEETESVSESTHDTKTSVNIRYVSQCPGYHCIKQEDYYTEVIKSFKPNNEICGETTLNGNNIKEFGTLDKLTQEQRIQPGEKPYHCVVDVQNFERNNPLEQHERNCTREKSHGCGICGKLFVKIKNLESHQRIHTKEKLYSCTVCGKQFRTCGLVKYIKVYTQGRSLIVVQFVKNNLEQRVD